MSGTALISASAASLKPLLAANGPVLMNFLFEVFVGRRSDNTFTHRDHVSSINVHRTAAVATVLVHAFTSYRPLFLTNSKYLPHEPECRYRAVAPLYTGIRGTEQSGNIRRRYIWPEMYFISCEGWWKKCFDIF